MSTVKTAELVAIDERRLLRRLDKKLPHSTDIIPLRVVRLCAHQLRRRQHRSPLLPRHKNKKPACRNTSAAGKSFITMDLPPALNAPSPATFAAHRSRREIPLRHRA